MLLLVPLLLVLTDLGTCYHPAKNSLPQTTPSIPYTSALPQTPAVNINNYASNGFVNSPLQAPSGDTSIKPQPPIVNIANSPFRSSANRYASGYINPQLQSPAGNPPGLVNKNYANPQLQALGGNPNGLTSSGFINPQLQALGGNPNGLTSSGFINPQLQALGGNSNGLTSSGFINPQLQTLSGNPQLQALGGNPNGLTSSGFINPQLQTLSGNPQLQALGGNPNGLTNSGYINPQLQTLSGNPQLQALNGNPQLQALNGNPQLQALNSNPQLQALNGNPQLQPFNGNPQLQALNGNPQLQPLRGNPQLHALGGNPQLQALGGNPQLQALGGNPQLQALGGNPQLQALGGNPQLQALGGNPQLQTSAGTPNSFSGYAYVNPRLQTQSTNPTGLPPGSVYVNPQLQQSNVNPSGFINPQLQPPAFDNPNNGFSINGYVNPQFSPSDLDNLNGYVDQQRQLPVVSGNAYINPDAPQRPASNFANRGLDVAFQWRYLDWVHPTVQLSGKNFTVGNPLSQDVDIDRRGRVFVTSPQWLEGTPITLSVITDLRGRGGPLLTPYPDWTWHKPDCDSLVSVYRVAIDECNRLWMVDTGTASGRPICPMKLMAFDLKTDQLFLKYLIPEDQTVGGTAQYVNPIVEVGDNCKDTYVYVADVVKHGLLVYSLRENRSWRLDNTRGNAFGHDEEATNLTIAGETIQLDDGTLGMTLSPRGFFSKRYLYFNSLASFHQKFADVDSLKRSFRYEPLLYQSISKRVSQAGVQSVSKTGAMFFQLAQFTALACWNIGRPFSPENVVVLAQDEESLQYISGMKVVTNAFGEEELWFNTNRLQKTINNSRRIEEVNFRLMRGKVEDLIRGTRCAPSGYRLAEPNFQGWRRI